MTCLLARQSICRELGWKKYLEDKPLGLLVRFALLLGGRTWNPKARACVGYLREEAKKCEPVYFLAMIRAYSDSHRIAVSCLVSNWISSDAVSISND
jgi:hypothetical protein